jgi:hypothetical protein
LLDLDKLISTTDFFFYVFEMLLPAGVTGRQGIVTPPWSVFAPFFYLYLLQDLRDWWLFVIYANSSVTNLKRRSSKRP